MKKFFFALMVMCGLAYGQTTPPIIERQFYDDTYVHVPLQFGFPFYGRTFTNSWMHSNGVVSFLDPAVPTPNVGYNPGQWAYCCEGVQPSTTTPQFSYMIAPLWTDLYPVGQSRFRTQGDATFQRYHWENIAEISNMSNLNTFGLEIRPSGYIGALYERINIQNQNTWVGTIGDPTLGQWNQIYYGRGIPQGAVQNWSMNDTGPVDMCIANPLSSPTCAGYTEAMCASNPLYSTSCSGYASAYFNQQCSLNSLYNPQCPGYAAAYLEYQCSVDPLYSVSCQGYEAAYFNQQCTANPLYNISCSGYETAYFNQQCSLNPLYNSSCAGYADAYYVQQCTANPLYDSGCTGYAQAYYTQQCTANPLYDSGCVGYETAYFNQQCSLDALYNSQCPGYAAAYALKYIVVTTPTTTVETKIETTSKTEATPTISSDGTVTTTVSATGDSNVDKAIETKTTSATTATAPAAAVQLAPTPTQTTTVAKVETKQEQKKEETKNDSSASSKDGNNNAASTQSASAGDKKEQPKTTRQALAERRLETARAKAIEEGKNLANKVGEAATMEAQVAVQNVLIAAMGFTPGFQTYNVVMLDGAGYKPFEVYKNQRTVDNARTMKRLSLASDMLHEQIVESQYRR